MMQKHLVDGVQVGEWRDLNGRSIYLALRTKRQIYKERWAWCIERITLEKSKERGAKYVGVALREKGKTVYYLAFIDDFYGPNSFVNPSNRLQLGLPLVKFRITPDSGFEYLEKKVRLGK